jgi:hypothetical protein
MTPSCRGKLKEEVHNGNYYLRCNFFGLFDVLCSDRVRIRVAAQVIPAWDTAKKLIDE